MTDHLQYKYRHDEPNTNTANTYSPCAFFCELDEHSRPPQRPPHAAQRPMRTTPDARIPRDRRLARSQPSLHAFLETDRDQDTRLHGRGTQNHTTSRIDLIKTRTDNSRTSNGNKSLINQPLTLTSHNNLIDDKNTTRSLPSELTIVKNYDPD